MTFRVYLRDHDGGRLSERTVTPSPHAAIAAYRELLARDDLVGKKFSAVLTAPSYEANGNNQSVFYSRFDREVGHGRIAADDPRLDVFRSPDEGDQIANSLP